MATAGLDAFGTEPAEEPPSSEPEDPVDPSAVRKALDEIDRFPAPGTVRQPANALGILLNASLPLETWILIAEAVNMPWNRSYQKSGVKGTTALAATVEPRAIVLLSSAPALCCRFDTWDSVQNSRGSRSHAEEDRLPGEGRPVAAEREPTLDCLGPESAQQPPAARLQDLRQALGRQVPRG